MWTFNQIKEITTPNCAACCVYLESDKTYILGGTSSNSRLISIVDNNNMKNKDKQLTLNINSCSTYWSEWNLNVEFNETSSSSMVDRIENMRKICKTI